MTSSQIYDNLSPQSKVWIYQSERSFTPTEEAAINQQLQQFTTQWAAHGSALQAYGKIYHAQFIVLLVDETAYNASGCSIDTSVKFLKSLEQQYQLNLFNRLLVTYLNDKNQVKSLSLADFKLQLAQNTLNQHTIVFNNLVQTKAEFEQQWQVPVAQSWHKQLLVVK